MMVLGYNTRLVKAADAPRRYEDLLDPKWKDQMALEQEDSPWFMTLMEYWGEAKRQSILSTAAGAESKDPHGHTHLAQSIVGRRRSALAQYPQPRNGFGTAPRRASRLAQSGAGYRSKQRQRYGEKCAAPQCGIAVP